MIVGLYALCFVLSMIFLVLLAMVGQRQNITNFLLLFVAIMIIILGYFTISIAPTLIVAVRGNNLVDLGNVFTPLLLFLSVLKLCHRRIPRTLLLFLLLFAGVIIFYYPSKSGLNRSPIVRFCRSRMPIKSARFPNPSVPF